MGNGQDEEQFIPIRMFIDMDEDDENSKNININNLFRRVDESK